MTYLTVFVSVLESLDKAQNLIHTARHRSVVHGDLTKDAVDINDVESAHGVASLEEEGTVLLGDLLVEIREQRDVERATEATLLAIGLNPSQMAEHAVDRPAEHGAALLLELSSAIAEGEDLGGAHEGPVQRVGEEHNVLALVVRKLELLENAVLHTLALEIRSRVAHNCLVHSSHC